MFRAILLTKEGDGPATAALTDLDESRLPDGDVTVAVEYSSLNYKDGLCLSPGGGGLVRTWPHVPGIDFAGVVSASRDPRFRPGMRVLLTGWRVGEVWWGGFAEKACVKGDWLVPVPDGLTTRDAMAIGTAGFAAMMAVDALEHHGLLPGGGPVLVTGASGGVGSVAVALLAALGHEVVAVTGSKDAAAYLAGLGAARILPRATLDEVTDRPLERETWAGCVDTVGGRTLARALGQMASGASVAAVGNAGGVAVPANIIPFLLRGINLLGINTVPVPRARRIRLWQRIVRDLPLEKLRAASRVEPLGRVPDLGRMILKGAIRGRTIIDTRA